MGPSVAKMMAILVCTIICATTVTMGAFGSKSDGVLLRDVSVLTLYKDRMTSGRRSSPVSQLACVGGTARGHYMPAVVQCYNRGTDGHDIQWECKADMDNAFRFGSVEVTCEGYDYPDDDFILKGSCGLEFTLDFTEEGYQRYNQQKSHSYSGHHGSPYDDHSHGSAWGKKSKSVMGDLLFLGGIAVVIYIVYKSCLAPNTTQDDTRRPQADRGDSPPPYSPPPYGFREEYMPGSDSCHGSSTQSNTYQGSGTHNHSANNQGGGFWSGAATGGLLGYLFGRNTGGGYTQTHYHQPYSGWGSGHRHPYSGHNTGWFSGSSWGSGGGARTSYGGSSSSSRGGGGGASVSSGTRTASGFGGTKRR